jgi:hypothetical protein
LNVFFLCGPDLVHIEEFVKRPGGDSSVLVKNDSATFFGNGTVEGVRSGDIVKNTGKPVRVLVDTKLRFVGNGWQDVVYGSDFWK